MNSLTPQIEEAAKQLQKAIGLPISSVTVNFSDDGSVQNIRPELVIKRLKVKAEKS